jgi:hypothetical protein
MPPRRPVGSAGGADRPPAHVEDASDDLPNDPLFRNTADPALRLRSPAVADAAADDGAPERAAAGGNGGDHGAGGGVGGLSAALMREGAAIRDARAAREGAGAGDGGGSGGAEQLKPVVTVVRQFAADNLLMYNGTAVRGWTTRPHVIHVAFQLLTGSDVTPADTAPADAGAAPAAAAAAGAAPAGSPPAAAPQSQGCGQEDPLGAIVALVRALWEYLHVHSMYRKLAKPFKVACALRNVLLLSDPPLYARWGGGERWIGGVHAYVSSS